MNTRTNRPTDSDLEWWAENDRIAARRGVGMTNAEILQDAKRVLRELDNVHVYPYLANEASSAADHIDALLQRAGNVVPFLGEKSQACPDVLGEIKEARGAVQDSGIPSEDIIRGLRDS